MDTAEIISTTVIFFLIMDPLGNIPLFLSVLKEVPGERRFKITLRELLIAYVALLIYLFFGRYILDILGLTNEAIAISGGIILFLIAPLAIFLFYQRFPRDEANPRERRSVWISMPEVEMFSV